MELSPARRRALFFLIVLTLAALGYWLVLPGLRHQHAASHAAARTVPATSLPAVAPSVPAAGNAQGPGVNIYNWLPFTQAELADAARVAVGFCVAYDTYSYTENAAAYVGTMNGLITSQLAATLENGYNLPGVAALRTAQRQQSTAQAQIMSLRAFGPTSLTFVVAISQRITGADGTSSATSEFAVTLVRAGPSWQVNDIEPQSAGNT